MENKISLLVALKNNLDYNKHFGYKKFNPKIQM